MAIAFILDDNDQPVPADTVAAFKWKDENEDRSIVAQDTVKREADGRMFWVSTVFLAVDHSFTDGPPVLWETMVFDGLEGGGPQHIKTAFGLPGLRDHAQDRYSSLAAAKAGHRAMVDAVRRGDIPEESE